MDGPTVQPALSPRRVPRPQEPEPPAEGAPADAGATPPSSSNQAEPSSGVPVSYQEMITQRLRFVRDIALALRAKPNYHGNPEPTIRRSARFVNNLLEFLTQVHNMATKLSTELSTELEANSHADLSQLEDILGRLNILLSSILEIPTHVKAVVACEVLTYLPVPEDMTYKSGLEQKLVKTYVIQREIEQRLIQVEGRIEMATGIAFEDYLRASEKE
ncbi:hypothetical protein TWF730_001676 [Orbilia blumenaviensis]|uniref:Uncharacterized protein n=1 Tax=Orbilia blumenaviensis TaxID=1796055 RepID=A0AAV9UPK9_9PEZI